MAIYLDYNATTPLHETVLDAMLPWLASAHGNPSSVHTFGRKARVAIDNAREQIAQTIHAHPSQIIFTSGGTEANNFVIKGMLPTSPSKAYMAVSAIEHASVLYPAADLIQQGWQIQYLPVNAQGQVMTQNLQLHPDTCLVSTMLANNETGVIQDVAALADVTVASQAALHIDASQAIGKLPVDFTASRAQFMTLSAHKFYGPQGIGALVTDKTHSLKPLLQGGGQEKGLRGGTENVANIVGFGCAAELVQQHLTSRIEHMQTLRSTLEQGLRDISGLHIIAPHAERLPNTVMVTLQGFTGETLLMELNRKGFAVSSGSACHSEKTEPSHVLLAMGISAQAAQSAIRISLGIHNTQQDIQAFITALHQLVAHLSNLVPSDLAV